MLFACDEAAKLEVEAEAEPERNAACSLVGLGGGTGWCWNGMTRVDWAMTYRPRWTRKERKSSGGFFFLGFAPLGGLCLFLTVQVGRNGQLKDGSIEVGQEQGSNGKGRKSLQMYGFFRIFQ